MDKVKQAVIAPFEPLNQPVNHIITMDTRLKFQVLSQLSLSLQTNLQTKARAEGVF